MKYATPIPLLLLACLWITSCAESGPGTSYYVSTSGDDSDSGLSKRNAWKSIDRVNGQDFEPGDRILFRGGDTFQGRIVLDAVDEGTLLSSLLISSYGVGKAIISGEEAEGLKAVSCNYLSIEGLRFKGSGRNLGNTKDGLLVHRCNGIFINDIEVSGFQHSGIHLHQCNDAVITYVHAYDNGFAGIHVSGTTIWDSLNYDNENLYIGYCVAENNPGDPSVLHNHSGNGILASSVKGGIIEYCEAFNNGWDMPWTENGPVGIWIWDCTDFIIQHCISHHNKTNPVAADGGGFDLDGGVSNSVIQYCISHNNQGAGFGLYEFGGAKPWENNTIRYNISKDDGKINGGSLGIWKADGKGIIRNCNVYNNTFFNSLQDGCNIWLYDNYPGFRFHNNVFVYNGSLLAGGSTIGEEIFQGNLYWNLAGEKAFSGYETLEEWARSTGKEIFDGEFIGLFQDPMLTQPDSLAVTDPSKIDQEFLRGYVPLAGSPLVDAGLDLKLMLNLDAGERDLLGTSVPSKKIYDIGAIELDY